MKNLAPVLPILFAGAILALVFGVMHFRRKKNLEILESVAMRRGGTVRKGFLFNYGTLTFPHGSHEITVHPTPGSKHSPPKTKVSCPLQAGRDLTLNVTNETVFHKAFKMVGAQDIELGSEAFDRALMVKGSDESAVKALLTPPLQERLLQLAKSGLTLSLTHSELALVIHSIPSSEAEYEPLLDAFLAFLDAVRSGNY